VYQISCRTENFFKLLKLKNLAWYSLKCRLFEGRFLIYAKETQPQSQGRYLSFLCSTCFLCVFTCLSCIYFHLFTMRLHSFTSRLHLVYPFIRGHIHIHFARQNVNLMLWWGGWVFRYSVDIILWQNDKIRV